MRSAAGVVALAASLAGCGLGVGPYQPRRDAFATAGGARPDLRFDEAERRAAHQAAKRMRVRELGGGETAMYAFDGGCYVGVKQGASQTRAGGDAWSASVYAFEVHAGGFERVLADHLVVGANLFAVGYGSGNDTAMASARYLGAGGELAAKVGLTTALALRLAGGRMHGQERVDDAKTTAGAWRVAGGLDWVAARLHGNDLVITAELQGAQAEQVDARALLFELVLVGI